LYVDDSRISDRSKCVRASDGGGGDFYLGWWVID
jgi:hypothetical protein